MLKLKPGETIPNPADPLGPPIGVLAFIHRGHALIVMRRVDESVEDMQDRAASARRIHAANKAKARVRLDRIKRARKNSGD